MTEKLYLDDASLLRFEARILDRLSEEGQPAVVLDRTAFYPESGGQPADTGTLAGIPVVAVRERAGVVLHLLGGPPPSSLVVSAEVDGARRRDHVQQHHGQHLISRALELTAGAKTVAFHLGSKDATIDIDRALGDAQAAEAETLANEVVWQARAVESRILARAEAEALGVELPPEAGDRVRIVAVEGFDVQACGGTHPRTTAEVGAIQLLSHERYKGGTRVHFVCGQRALTAWRERRSALDAVGSLVSAAGAAIPDAVRQMVDAIQAAQHERRDLMRRVVDAEAHRMVTNAPSGAQVVAAVYDGWAPEDLRALAARATELAQCVALLGSRTDKAHLVFAQSEGLGHDIAGLLRDAAELLGGRGGGRGNLAQGGGPRLDLLDEAITGAAAALRSAR
jgi:alanyl-tRNA synthetase